jgi:hypothetical protein
MLLSSGHHNGLCHLQPIVTEVVGRDAQPGAEMPAWSTT